MTSMNRFNNTIESEKWKCRLTPQRLARLDEIEALMIRCFSVDEIVKKMKIGRAIVINDLEFIRKAVLYRKRRDYWEEKIVNTLDHQLKEMWSEWDKSKTQPAKITTYDDGRVIETPGKADPRWQSGILAVLKEAATVTGIREAAGAAEPVIVEEETKRALAPMSKEEYEKLIQGGMPSLSGSTTIDVEIVRE